MEIHDHKLSAARFTPSPNHSRRHGDEISLLVIHNISLPPGQFGGPFIEDFFCNRLDCSQHDFFQEIRELRVSSHLLIRRNGEILQFVPFDRKAWHAGASRYEGRDNCNEFSIGIELEGTDNEAYANVQYEKLAGVTHALLRHYPGLNTRNIVGHSDIAPGRKTDPGPAFDWRRFRAMLAS